MKIVLQREEKDCGICCLSMIIQYYKGFVPLEVLRMDAKTDKNGTSALNMVLTAQKYGFDAMGLKLDNLSDIPQLPSIAHLQLKNGYTHYVLILKVTKNKVTIIDPAKGKEVLSLAKFKQDWTGVVIVFYPKRKIVVLKNKTTLFKILKNIYKQEKKIINIIMIVNLLFIILSIIGEYYLQTMMGVINGFYDYRYIKWLFLLFFFFLISKIWMGNFRLYLENHVHKSVSGVLYRDFLSHLFKLPLEQITSRKSGDIVARVEDLNSISQILVEFVGGIVLDLTLLALVLIILININLYLFMSVFILSLIYLFICFFTYKVIYKKAYNNICLANDSLNSLYESVKMISSIKNMNCEDVVLKKMEKKVCNFLFDEFKFKNLLNKIGILKNIIDELYFFMTTSLGIWLVFKQKIDIWHLITFNMILNLYVSFIKKIGDGLPKLSMLRASLTKVNEFLNIIPEKSGRLEVLNNYSLKGVNLSYQYNSLKQIFTNLNFEIKEGEFVLLKGPSGCGKSTVCHMLNKCLSDFQGLLMIGDVNIKDLSVQSVRNNILYVGQNEALETDSIYNNIIFNREVSNELFRNVCEICHLDQIVENKVLRYESIISDEEGTISGGERQRIILARALLNQFKILILDEALSEVDMGMEMDIITKLRNSFWQKTIIFISHKKYKKIFDQEIDLGKCQ